MSNTPGRDGCPLCLALTRTERTDACKNLETYRITPSNKDSTHSNGGVEAADKVPMVRVNRDPLSALKPAALSWRLPGPRSCSNVRMSTSFRSELSPSFQ